VLLLAYLWILLGINVTHSTQKLQLMDLTLQNKHALVCGSTQGIGKAVAMELAALGATVILLARNAEKLMEVVSELPVLDNQQHGFIVADFSQPAAVKSAVDAFMQS
jgi:3-oxoacyl-[acyl-carrier protein] reductase